MTPLSPLPQRRQGDVWKLEMLRQQLQTGVDALERGDFADINDSELEDYLMRLVPPT
jgi:hypothetical protein